MYYFIFLKNLDDIDGTIYKIAENQSDLNNLNISQSDYKIIETSENNFNEVKFGAKHPLKYNNNNITFIDIQSIFKSKENLKNYIDGLKFQIIQFTNSNLNHPLFNRWNDYYNQLNNLNLDNITYPINKPLEQYFSDLEKPSLNILQLP